VEFLHAMVLSFMRVYVYMSVCAVWVWLEVHKERPLDHNEISQQDKYLLHGGQVRFVRND
jgi:hypothetical protein